MLTFVTTGGTAASAGPVVTALSLVGNNLSATIAASAGMMQAAEYWIDAGGAHTTMTGSFGAASVNASATIAQQPSGSHTVFVRGQDSNGTWGAPRSVTFAVDTTGPITSALTLTPNPSSGSVSVALHGTANDTTTGGSNVTAAEYFLGAVGAPGTGVPVTVNVAAPVASLDKTIAPPVGGFITGTVISVRSKDALGNWGGVATITLNVSAGGGPVTAGLVVSPILNIGPPPLNAIGALPLNASQPVVRITATMTITGTIIGGAEGFIDSNPATTVRGFPFVSSDGAWNSATETGYADIPFADINALSVGNHTITVRGKDALGNWGATASVGILIDRTAPTFTGVTLSSTVINAASGPNVTLTVNGAADTSVGGPASGLFGGEYWIDTAAPAPGGGTAFTGMAPSISIVALTNGTHTIGARIRDASGNWSANTASATLQIDRTVPTVITINRSGTAAATTNVVSVQFLVTFSESVTGGGSANFGLTTTGTLSGASITGVTGTGATRTVTVNTGSGDGTLRLNMTSSTGVADPAGNPVAPLPFSTGQVFTIDKTRPTVSITRVGSQFTNGSPVQFSVTFSEPVTGVATNDFQLVETLAGHHDAHPRGQR